MSKATRQRHASIAAGTLRERVQHALAEGRFQSALDLAKQWHRAEPGPESTDLLKKAIAGRAKQLRDQSYFADAAAVIEAGLAHFADDPAQVIAYSEELARCGAVAGALRWLGTIPDPKPENKVLPICADAALQRGTAGRALLPVAMHGDFDRIRQAFAHLEAGRDDAVRETLQGISLSSPFLEWRVLLRGLLAYHQNDPTRAIENWSRLDPQRFPARLAAPYRLGIDRDFAAGQSPAMQRTLQQQADRLGNDPVVRALREIQRVLANDSQWHDAIRAIERSASILKVHHPDLKQKLARIALWEIIDRGAPEDLPIYLRSFGFPADDPDFRRTTALACERHRDLDEAHGHWAAFEKNVASMTHLTPEVRERLRAHVWFRMATNAATFSEGGTRFMFGHGKRTLKPSESVCIKNAAKLAPEWFEPVFREFCILADRRSTKSAIRAGEKLLNRFPGHAPTLRRLADVCRAADDHEGYARYLRAAAAADPLNRELQAEFGWMQITTALVHMRNSQWTEARDILNRCAASPARSMQFLALAALTLCELAAGDSAAGEDAFRRSSEFPVLGPSTDAVCAALAAQWDLPAEVHARFSQAFKEQLAAPAVLKNAIAWASMLALFQSIRLVYFGRRGHLKKVLTLVRKVGAHAATAQEMQALGRALLELKANKPLERIAKKWRKHEPESPYPMYFELEALVAAGLGQVGWYRVSELVKDATKLAEKMPAGLERVTLEKRLAEIGAMNNDNNPLAAMFDVDDDFEDDEEFFQ